MWGGGIRFQQNIKNSIIPVTKVVIVFVNGHADERFSSLRFVQTLTSKAIHPAWIAINIIRNMPFTTNGIRLVQHCCRDYCLPEQVHFSPFFVVRRHQVCLLLDKNCAKKSVYWSDGGPVYSRASSPMYQSSTFLRAQGVLRKNVRLDFTVGLN